MGAQQGYAGAQGYGQYGAQGYGQFYQQASSAAGWCVGIGASYLARRHAAARVPQRAAGLQTCGASACVPSQWQLQTHGALPAHECSVQHPLLTDVQPAPPPLYRQGQQGYQQGFYGGK